MSSRLMWSLVPAGLVLAMSVVAFVISRFDRPKARARAVEQLALRLNLAVPPGYADRLNVRMRRRSTALKLIIGPIGALWIGWLTYAVLLAPGQEARPHTESPVLFNIPISALCALALAASHVYDSLRSSNEAGPRVARIVEPTLRDAVPPVLTWVARAAAVLPLLAGLVWLFAPVSVQHAAYAAAQPQPVLYVVAAVLCPVLVAVTEFGQKRILAGRQNATTPQELAFDDALRVQAVLALLSVPLAVCLGTAVLIASPLGNTAVWSGSSTVFSATLILALSMYFLPVVTGSRWASRYYLRRFRTFSRSDPAAAC